MSSCLIDTQKKLDDACRCLAAEAAVGVDTEFLRVKTYYPKLALVQVSTADTIYCFDPLVENLRLDDLWSILAEPGILKVIHSARQDIEVLNHTAAVMPVPLFDTQIAAGLLGYSEQTGYAGLVEAELGQVLPKGAQRTDWTKRPLSEAQLGYAENDVRYLLPLRDELEVRLDALGRLDWAREDFERVLDPGLYEADPESAYRRVGRGAYLKRPAQHHLRNLCAWRERAAKHRDLPRHWVMDDETIASIAAAGPRSVSELEGVEGLRRDVVRRDGDAIVRCITTPAAGEGALWSKRASLTPEQKATRAALLDALKSRASELGIVESVLTTRADVEKLVRGAAVDDVVVGWRRRVVGDAFERILAGSATVREQPDRHSM